MSSVVTVAADVSRLKEVERLKDEFLSVASHELKSPLTSLKGFAQLLQRRMQSAPDYQAYEMPLRTIVNQVDRVTSLVNRLLDVSGAQMGRLETKPERCDLAELVCRQVQQARMRTDQHRLTLDLDREMLGYWDRLEQVVGNLLDNAIRYRPSGGEVRVSLHEVGGMACLHVSDEGIGIAREDLPNLFTRYYRSKEAKQVSADGMGIGLYVTHLIVAAHGGRIWAESEPGEGSTFRVELPIKQPAGETAERQGEMVNAS